MSQCRQTEYEQAGFVRRMLAAARRAEHDAGTVAIPLDIGGARIDLLFAGSRMIGEVLPALRHLVARAETPPAVRVHVWDSHTTGISAPKVPCRSEHFTESGQASGFSGPGCRVLLDDGERSISVMDLHCGEAVYWVRTADAIPYGSKATPLRAILHWSLERCGVQLLRAAAVGDENGAVLIAGETRAGKPRTALPSLLHGLRYAADDCLAVRADPEPTVHSLYSTARIAATDLPGFPALAPHVVDAPVLDGLVAIVRLYPAFEHQLMRAVRLRALLSPRITGRAQTRILPADAVKLRHSAVLATLSGLPDPGREARSSIEAMIGRLPAFELHLGSEPAGIAAAIRQLLSCDDATLRASAALATHIATPRSYPLSMANGRT